MKNHTLIDNIAALGAGITLAIMVIVLAFKLRVATPSAPPKEYIRDPNTSRTSPPFETEIIYNNQLGGNASPSPIAKSITSDTVWIVWCQNGKLQFYPLKKGTTFTEPASK